MLDISSAFDMNKADIKAKFREKSAAQRCVSEKMKQHDHDTQLKEETEDEVNKSKHTHVHITESPEKIHQEEEEEEEDDDEETNSLVSEYGSDAGQYSYRIDQIDAMEAIQEDDTDGNDEDGDSKQKLHDDSDETTRNNHLHKDTDSRHLHLQLQQQRGGGGGGESPGLLDAYYTNEHEFDKHVYDGKTTTNSINTINDYHQGAWIDQSITDLSLLSRVFEEQQQVGSHFQRNIQTTHKDRMQVLHILLQGSQFHNSSLCGSECITKSDPIPQHLSLASTVINNTPPTLEVIHRLERELALCRAEIGRLHNAARKELFVSPDKAILDDDETSESSSSSTLISSSSSLEKHAHFDNHVDKSMGWASSSSMGTHHDSVVSDHEHQNTLSVRPHRLEIMNHPLHDISSSSSSYLEDADIQSTITHTISNLSNSWNLSSFLDDETAVNSYDNHTAISSTIHPQSYHRVIMAPPGKIGITFVDFCGQAMVSHVSYDSPLSGWIFLHDILIAIDECTVSDMQVKDIVQILLNRKDKQRALVIMSNQAMTSTLSTREPSEIMI